MLDLGIQKSSGQKFDDEDYDTFYLSDLEAKDKIRGDIFVGDLKEKEFKGKEIQEFYVIITDHKNKEKWVCGIITSAYDNKGIISIYGEKGGRVYQLIDSLNHALNGTSLEEQESYSVIFDTFQETINEKVGTVTVKAVQPSNSNAKSPNLCIVEAEALLGTVTQNESTEDEDEDPLDDDPLSMNQYDDPAARQTISEITDELINEKGISAADIDDAAIRREAARWRKKDRISKDAFKAVREQLNRKHVIEGE